MILFVTLVCCAFAVVLFSFATLVCWAFVLFALLLRLCVGLQPFCVFAPLACWAFVFVASRVCWSCACLPFCMLVGLPFCLNTHALRAGNKCMASLTPSLQKALSFVLLHFLHGLYFVDFRATQGKHEAYPIDSETSTLALLSSSTNTRICDF